MLYTINSHCKFLECFNKHGILLGFLLLLQLQPSSKVTIPAQRDMKCSESGVAGTSENTMGVTVQRNCCFVQRSVMAPNPMLRGRTAKQKLVEEKGE